MSADICIVHDDLGWKNRTTRYNCRFSATSLALRVIFSGGTTEHDIIGFGELAAVEYLYTFAQYINRIINI